jgi:hypothetical protein
VILNIGGWNQCKLPSRYYVDVSPITRTNSFFTNPASGFTFPEATEEQAATLLKQEKFEPISIL